ncbi:MAG TPA: 2-oxoglutarate dehydrogenase complex dihydrolipoyllysine-residue succinyltransferase [Myxococcaceae bacterium]|nr:2-oxoglutarate dehydrogenase complex dihydrolipoyllysine-residue succinyltransferase [Myxococcaceae bacterium]
MAVELKVPQLGESITEAVVATWRKKVGESFAADEPLVELETDKVTVDVPAPFAGTIESITADEGATVEVGHVLGMLVEGAGAGTSKAEPAKADAGAKGEPAKAESSERTPPVTPTAEQLARAHGISLDGVKGTGTSGRITKDDVQREVDRKKAPAEKAEAPARAPAAPREAGDREERVKMTPLRRRVAERLKEAQNTAAMLTTFNEVDMGAVMELRKTYQDRFVAKHGVKLGFMSFFVRAAIEALKAFPQVNAEIDGDEVVFKHHYDIGVAVSGKRGLVVPVVRDADTMSLADLEKAIGDLGTRARNDKLSLNELSGGTFTISNGGIFGSMLSTPILNPPQTGILGMHNIVERPVARNGQVVIRPVMFLALSYDHRLVDGREAVQFLVRIKDCIEDPQRLLLDI